MGTQTNVKFSRMSLPIAQALALLRDEAFESLQIELRDFSRIQPTGEAAFPGYDAVGKLLKVRTVAEVLNEVGRGESFGLGYLVGIPAYVYLNFFEFDEESYSMLLTFDSSVLYFKNDENEPGELLERILTSIVAALDIDVCGYNSSNRYVGEFDALDVAEIVDGVRSGALLKVQPPFYYAIKTSHIATRDVRAVVSGTAATYKLRGGHHVVSAWLR
jgi:hypothetical protein